MCYFRNQQFHRGGAMLRGISAALFPDNKDDMPLGPTKNVRPHPQQRHVDFNYESHKHHHVCIIMLNSRHISRINISNFNI